ncbi:MAG: O-antigen polymerase [Clostridium sp.]
MIYNPFIIYGIVFILVCLIYQLPFSGLYPKLSGEMIIFLVCIIAISIIIGLFKQKEIKKSLINKQEKNEYKVGKSSKIIFIIYFIYCLGFIYSKQIPILNKANYLNYKGIPFIHVLVFNFNIYYAVYVFYNYLKSRKKVMLVQYIILYLPAILLVSRGLVMNIFIGSLFIFLIVNGKKIKKRQVLAVVLASIIAMYLFGVFGNLRSGPKPRAATNSEYIMEIGNATNKFRNNVIPKEFFWAYLYISSPLANFQLNMNKYKNHFYTESDAITFFKNDILLDAITKRLKPTERNHCYLIKPQLVVGTMFMDSYVDFGNLGITLVYCNFIIFYLIYLKLLKRNTVYYKIGIAMLCTLSLLSVFNNMIRFSGMSFQLLYPVLIPFLKRLKFKK